MSTLRRSPFPSILWLMLVVFLTIGVLDAPQALAKRDLQCGVVDVEGDPIDGMDIIGGSSSGMISGDTPSEGSKVSFKEWPFGFFPELWFEETGWLEIPVFEDGRIIWFVEFASFEGKLQ